MTLEDRIAALENATPWAAREAMADFCRQMTSALQSLSLARLSTKMDELEIREAVWRQKIEDRVKAIEQRLDVAAEKYKELRDAIRNGVGPTDG